MAAAAVSMPTVDLKSKNSFPVRLGQSILKPEVSKRYSSVRYNHKPKLASGENIRSTIRPSSENDASQLLVEGSKGEYKYSGRQVAGDEQYVLVARSTGNNIHVVLEKLEVSYNFNLQSTPTVTDRNKLAEHFPPLTLDDGKGDDPFGEHDEVQSVDPSNPFDYRNYLKPESTRVRTSTGVVSSLPAKPSVQQRPASTTPRSRPTKRPDNPLMPQKKRKAQDASNINPKRVKAGTEPPEPSASAKASIKAGVPRLRVERKATMRRSSLDDTGELILENETPVSETLPKRQGAMALALSGQLGQGPISLHSAASSPASRMESPMPERPAGMESDEEFELDESSPEAPAKQKSRPEVKQQDISVDDDEDADADVEDLELPSPVQTHQKPTEIELEPEADATADDDDDLDKQLALAMAEEDDGDAAPAPPLESEESEEE